jgi:hypothetical protein
LINMNVNLTISAALNNSSNQFVVAAYSDKALTVLVEQQNPVKPYASPFQVTFTTLTPNQMYYFVLWESTSSSTGGTIRNSCNFQPTSQSVTLRADMSLTEGISSGLVAGTTGYVDPTNSLAGWAYTLYMEGFGPLTEGVSGNYTLDSNNNWVLTGGNTVQPGQQFYLVFQPQMYTGTATVTPVVNSATLITANTTLDASYINKAILIQGAAASLTLNLPALSSLSDFNRMEFNSCGGSHVNVLIVCNGSDKIQRNAQVTKIVLGQNEILKIVRITISGTPYWFCDSDLKGLDAVGELFESYKNSLINAIPLDGSLVSRTTYQRLWDLIQTYGSGLVISDSNWLNTDSNGNFINKGFFTTGDGSTTFRVPDLRIYPTRRVVDGSTRIAGSFEADKIGKDTLTVTGVTVRLATASNSLNGVNILSLPSGSGVTNYGASNQTNVIQGTSTDGTKSKNTGVYLMIRV